VLHNYNLFKSVYSARLFAEVPMTRTKLVLPHRRRSSSAVLRIPLFTSLILALSVSPLLAGTFTAFGPESFNRGSGSPVTETRNFTILNPNTEYTLRINNGGLEDGEFEKVSSSVITLNGVQIVGPDEFNQNVAIVEKTVVLSANNDLGVELRGKPGGGITVQIIGVDDDLPTIAASQDPPPNAAGWNNTDVTLSFTCGDSTSGIASCPDAVIVTTESAGQVVSGTAVDQAGNTATTSITLNVDKTAPVISSTIDPSSNAAGWNNTDVTANFSAIDTPSGVASVTPPVAVTTEGANQSVNGTATDVAGNSAVASATVNIDKTPPTVAIASPTDGTTVNSSPLTVTGIITEALSGIASIGCNGNPATLSDSTFTCDVPLVDGANTIVVDAIDVAGNAGASSITVNLGGAEVVLSIISPAPGSVIDTSTVLASGTVPVPPGQQVGVTVNGVPALIEGSQFIALVSVDPSVTSLTATAVNLIGTLLASDTIPITVLPSATEPPVRLFAAPTGGIAPLTVSFNLSSQVSIGQISLDLEGDGLVDFQGPSLEGQLFTYSQPGIFTPTVQVTDSQAQVHSAVTLVQVSDQASLDARLQAVWQEFKDALRTGNVTQAVTFIHNASRTAYQDLLNRFSPATLGNIDQYMTLIQLVEVGFGGAQYEMLREQDGQTLSFAVWFQIDEDGLWRVRRF
jgi:PKD repeat protein